MSPSRRHAYPHAVRAARSRSRSARVARLMSAVVGVAVLLSVAVSLLGRADAAGPGTGVILYSDGATNEPWVRDWNGATWSAAGASATIHEPRIMAGAAARTRDELIQVGVDIHNDIRGQMWNGSTWAEFPFGTLGGTNQNYWWSQDVAYERLSDHALMVWANGSTGSIPISYRVWNGTSWTAEQSITTPVAGVVRQLHLAPSPDSDEMVLVVSDGLSRDYALVWNGSSWGNAMVLSPSGGTDDRTDVYVAYEQQSGDALVVYGTSATSLYFRTWNGAAWSAEGSLPIPAPATGNVRWATLASDPGSDRIGVGVTTLDGHSWLAVWDGAVWGSQLVATQNAPGTIFPSVAVGFESDSGQLVAIFGEGTSAVQYRTWTGVGGWSAQAGAFDVGDTPNTMMLDSDPFSDRVMATVQDSGSDLSASLWTGSGWGAVTQLEDDTREVKNQPWVFLWSRQDLPPELNGLGDYRDEFGSVAYNGSDGFLDWTSDSWVEIGDGNGAATPQVYVATRDPDDFSGVICPDGLCLIINDLQTTPLVRGASRVADLSAATTATFSFTYSMENDGGSQGTFYAEVRAAGNPWTRLATYVVTGNVLGPIAQSFDVTAHISAATQIRFVSAGTGSSDEFFVDDVTLTLFFGDRTDDEGDVVSFAVDGSDPFGDEITFSASGLPSGVGIDPVSGVVSGTISQTAASGSPYAVVIKVTDPAGNADTGSFNWTVNQVNVAPILADLGDQASDEGTVISLLWNATDEDVDTLTWTATGLPPGLSIDPATGLVSGTIEYTAAAGSPYAYKVRVTDDGSPSLFAEVSGVWTVANVNREPQVAHPGDQTNAEGDVVSFVVTAVDPDGDGFTWSATGLPSGLSIDTVTGSVSGTISFAASGGSPYAAVITAHDDGSPSAAGSISVTWTVTNVNRVPVVTNPGDRSNAEGDPVTFAMVGSDPDGDTLTWSASGLPSGLSIDPATGVISGTVGYDGAGNHVVVVRATDDGSPVLFSEVGFAWVVSGTNRTPVVADPGSQSSAEGATVSLAMVGSDPDLDGITWSVSNLPPGLAIDPGTGVISGTVSFDSAPGSPYLAVVRVTDDGSPVLFDEVSFSWSVADTNRAPQTVSPGNRTNAEGDVVAFALVGTDPDNDTLVWSASGLPGGLSIDPATGVVSGTVSFDSAPGSPYLVVVRATDDGSPVLFDEVAFAWAVSNTNRAPVVVDPGSQSSAENEVVALAVAGSDPDLDGVIWSASGLPAGLSIDPASGVISGTVSFAAAGNHAVTVRVTDDGSPVLFGEAGFAWVVSNTNRAPVVSDPGSLSSAEGDVVTVAVVGSDPDGDSLVWSASGLPAGLSIDLSSGVISGTVSFDAAGTRVVVVRATDDGTPVLFGEVSFSWSVANTNRGPVVSDPGSQAVAEGDVVLLPIVGADPDLDGVIWSASGLPGGLSIDPSTGVISGTLSFESAGSHAVTVRATDDGSPVLFGEVSFSWSVSNTNRAPVVTNPGDRSSAEGDLASLAVVGSDPDGDGVIWSASGLPAGLSIDPSTGVVSGMLSFVSAGAHSVTVRATDDGSPLLFDEAVFSWSVSDVNRAPVLVAPVDRSDAENEVVVLPISGFDPDGDTLVWSASGLPAGLSIDPASGVISGTVSFDAAAGSPYAVVVRATDDGSPVLLGEVSFSWSVSNTNRVPVVIDPGLQSTAEGQSVVFAMVGSDPDGSTLVWSASGLPVGLSIDPSSAVISGTLSFESAGVRSVVVRATDPEGGFGEVEFVWVASNVNRAPVLENPGAQTTPEGGVVSLMLSGSDPDGDTLTFSAEGLPPGLVMDSSSGVVSGVLGFDLLERYAVVVTVVDDGSPMLVSQVGFAWMVGEVNRPPVIGRIADRTSEVGEETRVVVVGSDPDDDTLVWSASGLSAGVTIGASSGVISGAAQTPGAYGVTVTLTDDGDPSLEVTEFFSWTVVSPPGYPVIAAIEGRRDVEDEPVSFTATASHPDGLAITWSAAGLPSGVVIDPATGRITGVPTTPGTWFTRVTVTDTRDQQATASFIWMVESAENLPPVAREDTVIVGLDEITTGGIAIDAAGNDHDPEGETITVVAVSPPAAGEAEITGGIVVFRPPTGWLGSTTIGYVIEDPAGNQAEGLITVTVMDTLPNRLGTTVIAVGPGPGGIDLDGIGNLGPGAGTEALLGSVFQSLYVLRVPLALLGGAVFWSLLLGGILNLGFVLRGGLPRLVRRASRHVAVVLAAHGERVDVLTEPAGGSVLTRLTTVERGIEATGRRVFAPDGTEWVEIHTDQGAGWASGYHLTEETDRAGFAADPEVIDLVEEFVARLRARRDFSDLISSRGLFVAHHAPIVHYPADRIHALMDDPTLTSWKGRNPAYPDFTATFDLAVAAPLLDAYDHPQRELTPDQPTTPATVIPVEFTNFHYLSIGADLHGPERLDQTAWIIVITYEAARPHIIGLISEG